MKVIIQIGYILIGFQEKKFFYLIKNLDVPANYNDSFRILKKFLL